MRYALFALISLLLASPALAASRDVEVEVSAADVLLSGTLTLPEGRPRAAVVLVQGNGPHGRDQLISGAPMFKELAEELAGLGIASVRVDNSGVGKSTGARIAHFKQRVPQMRAVFDALRARKEVAGVPLGLVGHSEGTMVATELWSDRADVIDFLVLLGAPGRQGSVVWVDQQSDPERFPGKDSAGLTEIRATFSRIADASIAGDEAALAQATDHLFSLAALTPAEIAEARPGFIGRMASAEMQVFLAHDPAKSFADVTGPVLAVWGTHDGLTDPAINIPAFLEHRNAASALTIMVLPNEDHFFLRGEGLPPGKHKRGQMKLSSRLAPVIASFVESLDAPGAQASSVSLPDPR